MQLCMCRLSGEYNWCGGKRKTFSLALYLVTAATVGFRKRIKLNKVYIGDRVFESQDITVTTRNLRS